MTEEQNIEQLDNETQKQSESNNNLDIPVVEPKSKFDATIYEGQRVQIEKIEKREVIDYYPNGNYDPSSQKMKYVIEITTSPIHDVKVDETTGKQEILDSVVTFTDDEGNEKYIQVNKRFNLQKDDEGRDVISKHPKASLWKFMRKMNVTNINDLKGKYVTITTTPSSKEGDDRLYLDIVTQ